MISEITGSIEQLPSGYWRPASLDNTEYARVCLPHIAFQQRSSGNGSAFGGRIVVDNGQREIHRKAIQESLVGEPRDGCSLYPRPLGRLWRGEDRIPDVGIVGGRARGVTRDSF